MSASSVQKFQQSLSRANATSSVVTTEEFSDALGDAIEEPAVGAPLPFSDLSVEDHPVTFEPTPDQLREATTGVTGSRLGISSLGTVAIESRTEGDEPVALYPERHVVVVRASDLCPDLESAFSWLESEFDAGRESVVFATGPSATGDMGALVRGVHGPSEVHAIIVEDNE